MLPNENGGFSIDMEPEQNNYPEQNGDSTDNDENFGTGDDILPLDSEEALFDMGFSSELLEQTTPKSAINKDDFDGDILSSLEDANREFSVKPSEETENFERADNNISEVDSSSEPGDPWSELQRQLEEMEKSGNFPGAF